MSNEVRRPISALLEPVQRAALEQYLAFVRLRDDTDPERRPANIDFNFGLERLPG